jgi:hypothetical protein
MVADRNLLRLAYSPEWVEGKFLEVRAARYPNMRIPRDARGCGQAHYGLARKVLSER